MKTIAIAGTFDSKGTEFLYVKKLVEELGLQTYTIHTGVFEAIFEPDVSNKQLQKLPDIILWRLSEKRTEH